MTTFISVVTGLLLTYRLCWRLAGVWLGRPKPTLVERIEALGAVFKAASGTTEAYYGFKQSLRAARRQDKLDQAGRRQDKLDHKGNDDGSAQAS
jgi:hypothetical protein